MNRIPPVERIYRISEKLADKPEFASRPAIKTALEQADTFDSSYITQIAGYLSGKNPDPRGAYDHIRHSGIPDIYAHMHACSIIYSWLHNELSTIDTRKVSEGVAEKISDLISDLMTKDPIPDYKKLMGEISQEIQKWYTQSIDTDRMRAMAHAQDPSTGAAMPTIYASFQEKIPKESPL